MKAGEPVILHDFGDGCALVGRPIEFDTPYGAMRGWEHAVVCNVNGEHVVIPDYARWALTLFTQNTQVAQPA